MEWTKSWRTTPSPTAYVVIDGIIQLHTASPTLSDSDLFDGDSSDSTNSPLIYIVVVGVVVLFCIIGPFSLWQCRRSKQRGQSSPHDLEIKHLSMMYLGTGHNGEVSPPSAPGSPAAGHTLSGRPRNIQNLPDLPMSPKMVSPGNDRDDEDDMKSPLVIADEREDDEIEDMYPQMAKQLSQSEREGRLRKGTLGQFQPPTRRRPKSPDTMPKAQPFIAIQTQSSTPSATPTAGNEQHDHCHPFMVTVKGVTPELAADEQIVDDIAIDSHHLNDDVIGSEWTDGADHDANHETKGSDDHSNGDLHLPGMHRLEDSGELLRVQQSVETNLSDNEVVDGDLWTAGGDADGV